MGKWMSGRNETTRRSGKTMRRCNETMRGKTPSRRNDTMMMTRGETTRGN